MQIIIFYIFFILWTLATIYVGWKLGSSNEARRAREIRMEDMKRYRKFQDEEYKRGYKDGFAQKSNAIRREIELDAAKTGKPLYTLAWPNGKGE